MTRPRKPSLPPIKEDHLHIGADFAVTMTFLLDVMRTATVFAIPVIACFVVALLVAAKKAV